MTVLSLLTLGAVHTALAIELLNSLDFEQLSELHRRVIPMLKIDIIGLLPNELALHVLTFLPVASLLQATLVNRHWHTLTEAQTVWRSLCMTRGWRWKYSHPLQPVDTKKTSSSRNASIRPSIDEGFNDGEPETPTVDDVLATTSTFRVASRLGVGNSGDPEFGMGFHNPSRHSTPILSTLPNHDINLHFLPDYKLLFRTRTILSKRIRAGQFKLTVVNAPGVRASLPVNFAFGESQAEQVLGHTSTIYAICLANDMVTGERTLFTASRDQTILQWRISPETRAVRSGWSRGEHRQWASTTTSSLPMRVFQGGHQGSVLSICVAPEFGYLVSGGSDGRIVVWDMRTGQPVKILVDPDAHEDSVLCVRCDDKILVSCSKG